MVLVRGVLFVALKVTGRANSGREANGLSTRQRRVVVWLSAKNGPQMVWSAPPVMARGRSHASTVKGKGR